MEDYQVTRGTCIVRSIAILRDIFQGIQKVVLFCLSLSGRWQSDTCNEPQRPRKLHGEPDLSNFLGSFCAESNRLNKLAGAPERSS